MNFLFYLICSLMVYLRQTIGESSESENSDAKFLTDLVGDVQNHELQYLQYFITGSLAPQATSLIYRISSYTDDSYTTLIKNSQIQVDSLRSIVSSLPWHERVAGNDRSVSAQVVDSSVTSEPTESSLVSCSALESSNSSAGNSVVYAPIGFLLSIIALIVL